jgi:hypothetical protein
MITDFDVGVRPAPGGQQAGVARGARPARRPPLTKDAIAGRFRRLLAMADRRAIDLGLPSAEAFLSVDLLS